MLQILKPPDNQCTKIMYKIKQNKKSKFNSQQRGISTQQKRALLYDSERNCAKDSQVMILSKKGEYQFHSASPDMSGVFKTSLTVGSRYSVVFT